MLVKENRITSIDHSSLAIAIANNRLKLRSIAATVFCGQQALAFRGQDEDHFVIESEI